MELGVASVIVSAINESGLGEASIYKDYSGRGMGGRTTTAVSTDISMSGVLAVVMEYVIDNPEESEEIVEDIPMSGFCQDSLGKGMVIY